MVVEQFPEVMIDWNTVEQALAIGPVATVSPNSQPLEWATVAPWLQVWAMDVTQGFPAERATWQAAAQVLTSWQARRQG